MTIRTPDRIRANIAAHQERHDKALADYQAIRALGQKQVSSLSKRELCDEIRRAARRLYQLRRELTRAEAAQ